MQRSTLISFLILFVAAIFISPAVAAANPSLYTGTGFLVAPDIVVTCNHVIRGAHKIEIVYNSQIQVSATVINSDEASDLAVLRVYGLERTAGCLPLAPAGSVRQGDRVYTVGFPLPQIMGMQAKLSEGLISATSGMRGDLKMYQISTPVQPGNSGGPLLNERAEVVGVVAGCLDAATMIKQGIVPQNVNYAVKSDNLQNLLQNCSLDVPMSRYRYSPAMYPADIMEIAQKAVVFVMVLK